MHRRGKSSFGRRFKLRFPDIELPIPIHWCANATSQLELNEEETLAIFRYHSWHGYPDGMNLTFPGNSDYKVHGKIAGKLSAQKINPEDKRRWGKQGGNLQAAKLGSEGYRILAKKHAKIYGCQATIEGSSRGGKTQGKKNAENGHLSTLSKKYGKRNAEIALCKRWKINRNKKCICGWHQ